MKIKDRREGNEMEGKGVKGEFLHCEIPCALLCKHFHPKTFQV